MKKVIVALLAFLSFLFLPATSSSQNMQLEWSRILGTTGNNIGKSILADDEGYLYAAGEFKGGFPFEDSTIAGFGLNNVFIMKINPGGGLVWSRCFGGDGQVWLGGMCFDRQMNLAVTGSFSLSMSVNDTMLASSGGMDIYFISLDLDGEWLSIRSDGGAGNDFAKTLDVDMDNNLYIGGSFLGETLYGNFSLTSSGEWIWTPWGTEFVYEENAMFLKYGPERDCLMARQLCRDFSQVYSLAGDSQDNIYLSGYFSSADSIVDTVAGGIGNFLIFKYNSQGNLVGFIQEGSGNNYIKGNAMATDTEDNLYVAGYIGCTDCIFGDSLLPDSYYDAFLVKYDPDGHMQWINLIGQYHGDYDGNENTAHSLCLDPEGNVYLAGYYDGIVWNGIEIISTLSVIDFLVVKTHPDGTIENIGTYGFPSMDSGEGICFDNNGSIYLIGYTYLDSMSTEYPSYAFIAKIDSILPVSVPEAIDAEQVLIYPNPASGKFTVHFPGGIGPGARFTVSGLDGKVFFRTDVNRDQLEIDLSGYRTGLYFLRIESAGRTWIKKLIRTE